MSYIEQIARQEAQRQQCDLNIVLATIEAESDFSNIVGDSGNSLGPGQVWPQWHRDAFDYAGKVLNISVPYGMEDLTTLCQSNDYFSTMVAVRVINQVWLENNKNWHDFTLSYVGSGIPQWDYDRRFAIWSKYNNGNTEGNNYSSGTGKSGNILDILNATKGTQNAPFEPTNYGIVSNSSQNKDILYGRRYRVLVSNAQGVALDVSDLRCTFSIIKTVQMQPNVSELVIYNLNAQTENTLIKEGNRIVIEAGYEGDQYGKIFDGDVVQPIRDKEDGVTYKLTLISQDGDAYFKTSYISTTLQKGQTAREIIDNVVTQSSIPANFGSISENLDESKLTRGKVMFGLSRDYLRQIAQSQNATFYIEDGGINIVKIDDISKGEIIDLSPESGLVGTPAQTEAGITIKSLLNPRITTGTLVHIDNRVIREMQVPLVKVDPTQKKPQGTYIMPLDSEGIYKVIKITYKGDTRGDDWYCEMECLNQSGKLPSIATSPQVNPN